MEPSIFHGALPQVIEPMRISRGRKGVLDAGATEVLVDGTADVETQLTALGLQPGAKVAGYHSLWVDEVEETVESDLVIRVAIQCAGLARSGEKRRRSMRVYGRQIAVGPFEKVIIVTGDEEARDPVNPSATVVAERRSPKLDEDGEIEYKTITTPTGIAERWNINEPIIQVEDTYFVTSEPNMSQVGTAMTPSNAPTPPSWLWASYTEPTRAAHPNGWVLDARDPEEVFRNGSDGLWLVRDVFSYYQPAVPD